MAEMLLLARETPNADWVADRLRWKRGDVIHAMDDGTGKWGRREVGNDTFLIVKMPGLPVSDLLHLAEPELLKLFDGSVTRTRQRARFIDLDEPVAARIAGRGQAVTLSPEDAARFLACAKTKTPIGQVRIG